MPFNPSVFRSNGYYPESHLRRVPGKNYCVLCGERVIVPGKNWSMAIADGPRGKTVVVGYCHKLCPDEVEFDDLEGV